MKTKLNIKEEEQTLEHINAMTKKRKDEQEAQEQARTDEQIERARVSVEKRKWRCVLNLSLCAICGFGLYGLYAAEHLSFELCSYALSACLVCVGWHLNEAKRAFRRKGW